MATLALPRSMDAWLYRAPLAPTASATLLTSQGVVPWDESDPRWLQLNNLISGVQQQHSEQHTTVTWSDSSGASPVTQTVYGIPLSGRNNDVLGVLLVSSSRPQLLHLLPPIHCPPLPVP